MRDEHRDSVWKIFARICDTLSVFIYQAAIFYVQVSVCNLESVCVDGSCSLSAPSDPLMAWLYIELFCFYTYMASFMGYIAYHQLVQGVCFKKHENSDMQKTITDFVEYEHSNMIWFAFNFVLVVMPIIAVVSLNAKTENLDIAGAQMSYTSLMWVVCAANFVQFCVRPQIYRSVKKTKLFEEAKKTGARLTSQASGLAGLLSGAKKPEEEEDESDSRVTEKKLVREGDEYHYVWMEQVFNDERMWIWFLNLAAYTAILVTYLTVEGHELIYTMYLPLDMMINAMKAFLYFWHYAKDHREKAKKQELVEILNKKIKSGMASGLLGMMNKTAEAKAAALPAELTEH